MSSTYRAFGSLAACMIFVVLATAVALAQERKETVEQGQLLTVPILNDSAGASKSAKLEIIEAKNPNAGTPGLTEDKRSITYLAKNYSGRDIVSYKIKDPEAGQESTGSFQVSVVSPQRIITFDAARVGGVLGIILVLAIVLEIGLSTLFNWKYFEEHFLGKGLRTPIAIAVSAFFVFYYKLDTVSDLLSSFTGGPQSSFSQTTPGYIITAFIVAGGSSTVNQLFEKFGIRSPIQQPAQITVEFNRQNVPSTAPVNVSIDGKLEGTVDNTNRFPTAGKYRLDPGSHEIELEARDATGTAKKIKQTINVASGAEATVTMTI